MTVVADFRTGQLMKKLSVLWGELGAEGRKKYHNDFTSFIKAEVQDKSFSGSGELTLLVELWRSRPELRSEFLDDFESYAHYKINEG